MKALGMYYLPSRKEERKWRGRCCEMHHELDSFPFWVIPKTSNRRTPILVLNTNKPLEIRGWITDFHYVFSCFSGSCEIDREQVCWASRKSCLSVICPEISCLLSFQIRVIRNTTNVTRLFCMSLVKHSRNGHVSSDVSFFLFEDDANIFVPFLYNFYRYASSIIPLCVTVLIDSREDKENE